MLTTLGMQKDLNSNSIEDPVSITGLETFSLGYKVCSFLALSASSRLLQNWLLNRLICFKPILYGNVCYGFVFQVQWPLSIVISKKALSKYQLIFRFLFHCKHVERQLCGAWQIHQVWTNNYIVAREFCFCVL